MNPAVPAAPSLPADLGVRKVLGLDRHGRRRRWLRRGAIALPLLAVVLLGARAIRRATTTVPVAYETQPAARADLVVTVSATGRLEPANTVDVAPEISGRVAEVRADYNDRVVRGQVLVALDTDLLRAQEKQAGAQVGLAAANLDQAHATRDEARTSAARAVELTRRGVTSQADLDAAQAARARAEAAVAAAAAQLRAARAALVVAQTNLDKAVIRSPVDGVVLSRSIEPGQTVVAALQAPVLFKLAEDLSRMQLVVDVDEADVGRVHGRETATFTVAAYPERTFTATVSSIRNAAKLIENVVAYEAVLDVDNRDGLLRPGMTGTASISAQTEKDALVVPNRALRFHPRQQGMAAEPDTTPQVWVLRDGKPVAVKVTPGASDGSRTALVSAEGISPGDPVIVGTAAAKR